MSLGKRTFIVAAAVLCAAIITSVALATHVQHTGSGVVPMFCGAPDGAGGHAAVYTIPSTTALTVRLGWAVKNAEQATIFLNNQQLTWTVTADDGTVLYERIPSPEYGDRTFWSDPVYQEILAEGKRQKVYLMSYRVQTGIFIPAGETVTISYTLTASAKTDDGFGNRYAAGETISTWNGCTVTGV